MSNDVSLEQQIIGLGFSAPRITPEQIDALVEKLSFHTYLIPGTTTTLATALNPLGFEVATASANVSVAADFNEAMGRNAAIASVKAAARKELWKLEAYRLKQNVYEASKVGLLAGLAIYQDENLGDDLMFVGDLATSYCAVRAKPGPAEIETRPTVAVFIPPVSAPPLLELAKALAAQLADQISHHDGAPR